MYFNDKKQITIKKLVENTQPAFFIVYLYIKESLLAI